MKNILVVGSTGFIGTSIVNRFTLAGYNCLTTSSKKTNADYYLDLSKKETIENIICDLPILEGIIFVSGKEPLENLESISWEHLTEMINIHFKGVLWSIKNMISRLSSGGFIILTSSVAAYNGSYDPSYCAMKSAVDGLVRTLSIELCPIRVNSVAPGLVDGSRVCTNMTDNFRKKHIDSTPLKKLATVDEVADAYYYLSQSKHTTGQVIHINGGRSFG